MRSVIATQMMMMAGPQGDPNFPYVVSGLHFDGAGGSTTFTDIKGKTWTASGSPVLDSTNKQFGTASLGLNGSSSLSCSSSDFSFGTGDFTIRCWVRDGGNANNGIFSTSFAGSHTGAVGLAINGTGFIVQVNDTSQTFGTGTVPSGLFHAQLCRSGTSLFVFINGNIAYSTGDSRNLATGTMYIGGYYSTSFRMNGNIDDFEVYKGVCLNTSAFTPPTSAFLDL